MRKLRILYTSNLDLRSKGGAKIHFIELGRNLSKLGHELLTLVPGYSPRESQNYGLNIHYIPTFKESLLAYLWAEFLRFFYLIFFIIKFRPQVIYARPVRLDLTPSLLAWFFRIPYVMERNEILEDSLRMRGFSEVIVRSMKLIEQINFRLSNKVVCVTEGIKREIVQRYGVNQDKLIVIPNGANVELLQPMDKRECRRKLGLEEDAFYVGFIGSFAPWHGLEILIDSAKQVKEQGYSKIKYLLVGDGQLKASLEQRVKDYKLEGEIQFSGWVAYEEIPYYINAFDVAVAPFTRERNDIIGLSPLKLYEYLACGCPIIASRVEGVKQVVEESQCGYLFEPGDIKDLARRILQAYTERDKLSAMGLGGRQLVLTKHSWQSTARTLAEVLLTVLEKRG